MSRSFWCELVDLRAEGGLWEGRYAVRAMPGGSLNQDRPGSFGFLYQYPNQLLDNKRSFLEYDNAECTKC